MGFVLGILIGAMRMSTPRPAGVLRCDYGRASPAVSDQTAVAGVTVWARRARPFDRRWARRAHETASAPARHAPRPIPSAGQVGTEEPRPRKTGHAVKLDWTTPNGWKTDVA